jgi:hypothetical protein
VAEPGLSCGDTACLADSSVRFFRVARLVDELARDAALQNKSTLLRQIARSDLVIIDDYRLASPAGQVPHERLEIPDDRRCVPRPATLRDWCSRAARTDHTPPVSPKRVGSRCAFG